ncbi:hypothetical protein FOZ76_12950 [Verticiella sediminum]|uniref:DUF904 domain-containing protein n=1 Tax=Verticiella sediminum TaxID=1247510 RepID=A0A556AMU8_9BURK|nr:hypothetical protein [Verticiella sediminum]TSH94210.1 hypothetical protein FOZ76_12950 [Verticiella sediminum]
MLEDLDHLAVRVRQLAKYAESTKAELARLTQRSQAEQAALSESYRSQLAALTETSQREKAALSERLAVSEAENRHLRSLLVAARERVEDVLSRIPDPDARAMQEPAEQ